MQRLFLHFLAMHARAANICMASTCGFIHLIAFFRDMCLRVARAWLIRVIYVAAQVDFHLASLHDAFVSLIKVLIKTCILEGFQCDNIGL